MNLVNRSIGQALNPITRTLCLIALSLGILLSWFTPVALAQDPGSVELVMFYGQGCPHCARLEAFLDEIADDYPTLKVEHYEVYSDQDNREVFFDLAKAYGLEPEGVPTVFIDDQVIVGFSSTQAQQIESQIQTCLRVSSSCENPLDRLNPEDQAGGIGDPSLAETLTLPLVITAAAVDAINPCAFAVLVLLMGTILYTHDRQRALYSGLAFTASIYLSYLLMGIGLYSAIQASGLTRLFYAIVSVLAIVLGLFNLKDYVWYGKWISIEVPESWRPRLKRIVSSVTSVPGAFLIGFLVSLFLLPCTSGPYIVILGLLAETTTRTYALALLLLYNFIFVIPMLGITGLIYFGFTTSARAERWRQQRLRILHLISGAVILLLGIGMLTALGLGMI